MTTGFPIRAEAVPVSDVAICLALTVLYFAAGFAVLRRRDL